jgi:uncharacterized hydrophobic protein (TIGR00271 family)
MKNNRNQNQNLTEQTAEPAAKNQTGGFVAWLQHIPVFLFNEQKLTQTRKAIVLNDLVDSSSPGMDYFILIFLSCTIATFGLLTDSAAVIIGAMLVAPLMSPILSLSMASISGLSRLFKRSVIAIFEGAGIAILLSALIAFVSYRLPLGINANIPNEVLARTSPSPMDLGIALAGGAAAAYALAHPRLTAALPGVAIATALMPPLCTIGVGIAFMNSTIILGASLLFVTNLVAIAFAGILTFAAMGFGPRNMEKSNKVSRSLSISAILVLVIGLLLAALAWNTVSEARLYTQTRTIIMDSANRYTAARLVDLNISTESDVKIITATLRTTRDLTYAEVEEMQSDISAKLNGPVALEIIAIPMQILTPDGTPTPLAAP